MGLVCFGYGMNIDNIILGNSLSGYGLDKKW